MALSNPAPILYQNVLNYIEGKKQIKKTPSTGMMGFSESSSFKTKNTNKDLSPAERASNYFKILKEKRMALEAPHVSVEKKYKKVKAMKDAMTEKAAYYDTDNSRLRRRNEKAKSRMLDSFRN